MTSHSPETADILDVAASVLTAVARTDPDHLDLGAQLHCLHAAQHLRSVGAQLRPMRIAPTAARQSIEAALRRLSTLPPEVFAQSAVLDAAAAARRALELADDHP